MAVRVRSVGTRVRVGDRGKRRCQSCCWQRDSRLAQTGDLRLHNAVSLRARGTREHGGVLGLSVGGDHRFELSLCAHRLSRARGILSLYNHGTYFRLLSMVAHRDCDGLAIFYGRVLICELGFQYALA